MWSEIIVRYFHFISIILVGITLVTKHLMLQKTVSDAVVKRAGIFNVIYWISAILALVTGLILWLSVGKPAEFYTSNPLMHVKVTLFMVILLLTLKPTLWILKNSGGAKDLLIEVPKSVVMIYRLCLLIYFVMPLLATLIARGV